MTNIIGGGSHSDSGGTTVTASVSITVSGGDVTGEIYAKGNLDGDTVTDQAYVTFAGAKDYHCSVFGYSYAGTSDNGDALIFADYTGAFSGMIGGFNTIEFVGGTAMTLAAAADVSNSDWKFDVAERSETLTNKEMLYWENADFTNDTIKLNLAVGSSSEWTLVDAATTAYGRFDVLVDGESILPDTIALDEAIVGGDYDGWGFALEDSFLKFKHLA